MGDLVPLADHAAARAALAGDARSPWFGPRRETADWDPCTGCLYRAACREVRECHEEPPPALRLRPVPPPDIVA